MSALIAVISSMIPKWAVWGTGLKPLVDSFGKQFPGVALSPAVIHSLVATLPALYGDYPTHADVAPSAVFIAVYAILAIVYFAIFIIDRRRGHNFWLYFGLGFYALFRLLGFALRLAWTEAALSVDLAIVSTVFAVTSVIYINCMNLILAHRIFTFRHPETGNALWFKFMINSVYLMTVAATIMGIVAKSIPSLYYLTQTALTRCEQVSQVSGVLSVVVAFVGIVLVAAAYMFKPGTLTRHLFVFHKDPHSLDRAQLPLTVSAVWIEKFTGLYLPTKGSQSIDHLEFSCDFQPSVLHDNNKVDLTHAIRVISAKEKPAGGFTNHISSSLSTSTGQQPQPSINTAILIIISTSLILTLAASFRSASLFITVQRGGYGTRIPDAGFLFHNIIMYMTYGLMEVIVNVIYIVMRTDLRFYIPDYKLIKGKSVNLVNGAVELEPEHEKTMSDPVLVDNSSFGEEAARETTLY